MSERLCRACQGWHDLDQPWPAKCLSHFKGSAQRSDLPGPMIVSDIREYRASAVDKSTGQRPVIGGRRQHREFLRNNGYRELGNDAPAPRKEQLSKSDRVADIRRVMGD
jgi:hypothetical protein